jgi:hypothetical protein
MSTAGTEAFRVPPLLSGGLMLSYRCTNACKHCLYRCSPQQPDEWITLEMAERVFRALGKEPLQDLHLAGGEPTLELDLLTEIIGLARAMGITLSYVETNARWCTDMQTSEAGMWQLKRAGLPAILISVSMFHHEFVPFRNTRHGVEAARKVFGQRRTYVYLPHLYDAFLQLPHDGRQTLDEFTHWAGIADRPEVIATLYQVIPSGRATRDLRHCFATAPAEKFRTRRCWGDLNDTSHFHIDHHGDLFTGLCAGLAPASADDLHPESSRSSHPIFHTLATQGPFGLRQLAIDRVGHVDRPDGYVSKCDLCLHLRDQLHATGEFPELRPDGFYAEK